MREPYEVYEIHDDRGYWGARSSLIDARKMVGVQDRARGWSIWRVSYSADGRSLGREQVT